MDNEKLLSRLESIDFFNDFTLEEKKVFITKKLFCEYQADHFIIREGAEDRTFYVLIFGEVVVIKNSDPNVPLAKLGPGAVFGEIAHFARQVRATNVISTRKSLVFQVEHVLFKSMSAEVKLKINQQAMSILMGRLEKMKKEEIKVSQGKK